MPPQTQAYTQGVSLSLGKSKIFFLKKRSTRNVSKKVVRVGLPVAVDRGQRRLLVVDGGSWAQIVGLELR
jgi:hypothetical protein